MALLNKVYFSGCFSSSLPLSYYTQTPHNPTLVLPLSSALCLFSHLLSSHHLFLPFSPLPTLTCNAYALWDSISGSCVRKNTWFCLLGLGSPHLILCFPDPAIFSENFIFPKRWKIPLHICTTFFAIHLSVDCHLGWTQFLVIINKQITV